MKKIHRPGSTLSKRMSAALRRADADQTPTHIIHVVPVQFLDPHRQYVRVLLFSDAGKLSAQSISVINDVLSTSRDTDILIRVQRSPFTTPDPDDAA